ncbi:hypothetical protein AJ87_21670 [Rhizobium yanglingense]|nr:hypothetical protein AJ87_21670 [Rhizobium yanglingense]
MAAEAGGQIGQHRPGEQGAHLNPERQPPQPLHQLHRQQRMSAELEEVVVASDPLDTEKLRPDLCQRRLDPALRRRIAAARIGIVLRRRKPLAVQLAVRRQGQCFQPHEGRRHHVVRQTAAQVMAHHARKLGPIHFPGRPSRSRTT